MKGPNFGAGDSPRTRVPSVVPECDLRTLPLSPLEAYVFSRVDGQLGEDELVICTGLEATVVTEALDRLASFGALRFVEAQPRRTVSQTHTRAVSTPGSSSGAPRSSHASAAARLDSGSPQPSRSPEGTPLQSGSVQARTSLPATPHPAAPRASEPRMTPNPSAAPAVRRSNAPRGAVTSAPPGRMSESTARKHLVSQHPSSAGQPAVTTGLTSAPPARVTVSPSGEPPRALTPVPTTYRPGSLRPEYQDQMRRYLDGARVALSEGNATSASNYYRLAQQLAPNDPTIAHALAGCSNASAEGRASSDRAIAVVLLGDNAARARQWGIAAQAYREAAALVPRDGAVLYKLAGALYRSGGHLAEAAKLAEESIAIVRGRVEAWLLLAQIRLESGARLAAREAAEEARRLKPDDERVMKLLIKLGSLR